MTERRRYDAAFERVGETWVVTVPDLPDCRVELARLDDLADRVRSAIARSVGILEDDIDLALRRVQSVT